MTEIATLQNFECIDFFYLYYRQSNVPRKEIKHFPNTTFTLVGNSAPETIFVHCDFHAVSSILEEIFDNLRINWQYAMIQVKKYNGDIYEPVQDVINLFIKTCVEIGTKLDASIAGLSKEDSYEYVFRKLVYDIVLETIDTEQIKELTPKNLQGITFFEYERLTKFLFVQERARNPEPSGKRSALLRNMNITELAKIAVLLVQRIFSATTGRGAPSNSFNPLRFLQLSPEIYVQTVPVRSLEGQLNNIQIITQNLPTQIRNSSPERIQLFRNALNSFANSNFIAHHVAQLNIDFADDSDRSIRARSAFVRYLVLASIAMIDRPTLQQAFVNEGFTPAFADNIARDLQQIYTGEAPPRGVRTLRTQVRARYTEQIQDLFGNLLFAAYNNAGNTDFTRNFFPFAEAGRDPLSVLVPHGSNMRLHDDARDPPDAAIIVPSIETRRQLHAVQLNALEFLLPASSWLVRLAALYNSNDQINLARTATASIRRSPYLDLFRIGFNRDMQFYPILYRYFSLRNELNAADFADFLEENPAFYRRVFNDQVVRSIEAFIVEGRHNITPRDAGAVNRNALLITHQNVDSTFAQSTLFHYLVIYYAYCRFFEFLVWNCLLRREGNYDFTQHFRDLMRAQNLNLNPQTERQARIDLIQFILDNQDNESYVQRIRPDAQTRTALLIDGRIATLDEERRRETDYNFSLLIRNFANARPDLFVEGEEPVTPPDTPPPIAPLVPSLWPPVNPDEPDDENRLTDEEKTNIEHAEDEIDSAARSETIGFPEDDFIDALSDIVEEENVENRENGELIELNLSREGNLTQIDAYSIGGGPPDPDDPDEPDGVYEIDNIHDDTTWKRILALVAANAIRVIYQPYTKIAKYITEEIHHRKNVSVRFSILDGSILPLQAFPYRFRNETEISLLFIVDQGRREPRWRAQRPEEGKELIYDHMQIPYSTIVDILQRRKIFRIFQRLREFMKIDTVEVERSALSLSSVLLNTDDTVKIKDIEICQLLKKLNDEALRIQRIIETGRERDLADTIYPFVLRVISMVTAFFIGLFFAYYIRGKILFSLPVSVQSVFIGMIAFRFSIAEFDHQYLGFLINICLGELLKELIRTIITSFGMQLIPLALSFVATIAAQQLISSFTEKKTNKKKIKSKK